MNRILTFFFLTLIGLNTNAQLSEELLDFDFEGTKLSGVLSFPKEVEPKGIVLLLHGDGQTNVVAGKWWYDVRMAIVKAGYATFMWDKMGCGNSEGIYKSGRPVENEAFEVIAAINKLKESKIKGSNTIGLWGISRAGWIGPIVIDKIKDIEFWISVSGVDDDESFKYLLKQNLQINGYPKDTVDLIVGEWHNSILLSRGGASYNYYLSTSKNLQKNKFWQKITNGGISEKSYYEYQEILQESALDKETELPLYVENFDQVLSRIDIPMLALFGEMDQAVDWKRTKSLYEKSLESNTDLTIKTFPNCNHNMWQCTTGGIYEFEDNTKEYVRCDGFLESITIWLDKLK